MSKLTQEGSEHPLRQRVDGGVERDAEEEEEEVRRAQVQDEDVSRAAGAPHPSSPTAPTHSPSATVPHPPDHHHHHRVPHHPHHEDQPEHHWHDHRLRPGPVTLRRLLGPVGLPEVSPGRRLVSRLQHIGALRVELGVRAGGGAEDTLAQRPGP